MDALKRISAADRLVIKVGSALLARDDAAAWTRALIADVSAQTRAQIVLVTSGAIALGRAAFGGARLDRLEQKQAAAAIGQPALMAMWSAAFLDVNRQTAQTLLTLSDTEHRRRWLNARATLNELMARNVTPIVNENDTVATDEIRFGDNDRLAARVAELVGAEGLVLLSDVDGLYDKDPVSNAEARHIEEVGAITPEIRAMAGGPNLAAGLGSGGMASKLAAAEIAARAGVWTLILDGRATAPFADLANGARCTFFAAHTSRLNARRRWIASAHPPSGSVTVDAGAAEAVRTGKSLLSAGVLAVTGVFQRGETVRILDESGGEIGLGLAGYDAPDARLIAGRRSEEIEAVLGYRRGAALIHAEDLVPAARTQPS